MSRPRAARARCPHGLGSRQGSTTTPKARPVWFFLTFGTGTVPRGGARDVSSCEIPRKLWAEGDRAPSCFALGAAGASAAAPAEVLDGLDPSAHRRTLPTTRVARAAHSLVHDGAS